MCPDKFALTIFFRIFLKTKILVTHMRRNIILILMVLLLLPGIFSQIQAQTMPVDTTKLKLLIRYMGELEFQLALQKYVENLYVDYGFENLPREKFLISLMRLVNFEIRNRVKDPETIREKYFDGLRHQLEEVRALRTRLHSAGITELDNYIDELEARMLLALKRGTVDYKQKKLFDDALQTLYIAEETIKMGKAPSPEKVLPQKVMPESTENVEDLQKIKIDVPVNIFGLFEEWKKTQEFDFNKRLLEIKVVRSKLFKSGTLSDIQRMFVNQLRYAYISFNNYDYDLADRLLEDLIQTYSQVGVKDFEDVYFYWGESNFALGRYLRAQEIYQKLIQQYPGSQYLAKAYGRLIEIAYELKQPQKLLEYFAHYQNVASPANEEYFDIQFIVGLTLYKNGDFNRALDVLMGFPQDNPYYSFAQYLIGSIYAAAQNYDMAKDVFQKLIASKDTPAGIYSRALYKLALIHFEQGAYLSAIEALSFIPESFSRYDKVLNVLAWSFFMFERERTDDPTRRDYSQAKYYAKKLLDEYYGSEHRMEMESLLAYIAQQENHPDVAVDFYKDVYQSKVKKKDVLDFLKERDRIDSLYARAKYLKELALQRNDPDAYIKASDLVSEIERKKYELELSEMSPVGSELMNTLNDLLYQMSELRKLRAEAEAKGNTHAVAKIDSMMIRISVVLNWFPEKYLRQASVYNLFDAYPVTRLVTEYEYRSRKYQRMRQEIQNEINRIDTQIATLQEKSRMAQARGDYREVVRIEQDIARLREIRKKYDQTYAATFRLSTGRNYPEFDQWGDFGAFGIIDVKFGQRARLEKRMKEISQLYSEVNKLLNKRREIVEDKLRRIDEEIRFMTMKARLEERKRMRAEREREFRENYFDQRTSEFEEK